MTGNCPISSYKENSTRHVSYFIGVGLDWLFNPQKWKIRVVGVGVWTAV